MTQNNKEWEKEFEDLFVYPSDTEDERLDKSSIKLFISSLLTKQRQKLEKEYEENAMVFAEEMKKVGYDKACSSHESWKKGVVEEIEERFDERFCYHDTGMLNQQGAANIKEFLFSVLDQALADQREELRRIFDDEIIGIKNRGTLTPCGETTLKILEEIKEDLLKRFIPLTYEEILSLFSMEDELTMDEIMAYGVALEYMKEKKTGDYKKLEMLFLKKKNKLAEKYL